MNYSLPTFYAIGNSDKIVEIVIAKIQSNEFFCYIDYEDVFSIIIEKIKEKIENGFLVEPKGPVVESIVNEVLQNIIENDFPVGNFDYVDFEEYKDFYFDLIEFIVSHLVYSMYHEGMFKIRYFPFEYHLITGTKHVVLRKQL